METVITRAETSSIHLLPDDVVGVVARLSLDDTHHLQHRQKGKKRADLEQTDEEIAIQIFAEEAQSLLEFERDAAFARSLDRALGDDQALIEELARVELIAEEDREIAIAISEGRPPPARTSTQQSHNTAKVAETRLNTLSNHDQSNDASTSQTKLPVGSFRKFMVAKAEECVICRDRITGPSVRAACGHFYDRNCLRELFQAATVDESLFPPRCCQKEFILEDIRRHLGDDLLSVFEKKAVEFSTVDRVYCHRPSCSIFLGPVTTNVSTLRCPQCKADTCSHCKAAAHSNLDCSKVLDEAVLALAEQEGWKRCPGCHHLVELTVGCYHMTCRCRKQFCYVCTETWKNCDCPQWEENRLLATAEQRVQRQVPTGPPPPARTLEQMVFHEIERLRVNHDCRHTSWAYRSGAGTCDHCGHFLPQFLLQCRGCQTMACVRCRRNRL